MSDFLEISNRLDIRKSERDTTNDKSLQKSRPIQKVPYSFVIPRVQIDLTSFGVAQGGALVHQFNITAPRAFRILLNSARLNEADILTYALICVRYRVGTTVYRYRLKLSGDSILEGLLDNFSGVQAPAYYNQHIGANFCIEFWTLNAGQTNIDVGPWTVMTGLLRNPLNVDDIGSEIAIVTEMARDDLSQPLPDVLPTPYGDDSCFLTN